MYHENEGPIESLVHLYIDGAFNRRELLRRVAKHTGSAVSAAAAVAALGVTAQSAAEAQNFCTDDMRVPASAIDLAVSDVSFTGDSGTIYAHVARPRFQADPLPAVLVIHENRGLNEHIKDVTRRFARASFVGVGIDLLSREGGTDRFADPTAAGQAYSRTTVDGRLQDMLSTVAWMKQQSYIQGDRIGCVGFCAGGGNSFNLAVSSPDIAAAVVYYGMAPTPIDRIANLSSPILLHYAHLDTNFTAGVAPILTNLLAARKTFGIHIYEGVGHAFNNDTGAAFNRQAACEAWARTTDFFGRHLRRPRVQAL
jgi:carboxymethylenebutenolidase